MPFKQLSPGILGKEEQYILLVHVEQLKYVNCTVFSLAFLQYIWEHLYSTKSARDVGTLYQIRQRFGLVNVSAKVKNNFESANSLMLSLTKAYLCSAFMEYAGLEKLDGTPKNINLEDGNLQNVIGCFVDEYVMVEFDVEKTLRQQKEQAQQQANSASPIPSQQSPIHLGTIFCAV